MAGVYFRVIGTTLYSVNIAGVHNPLGTVEGTGRCNFANDGVNLFIANGNEEVFWYNGTTVAKVTDPDIDGAKAVTIINNQFVYTKDNLFIVSDVGDGSTASGLNAANAEVAPDKLVRAYAFDQIVYMFGEDTVESWYNSGVGSPPFDRVEGQLISVGCAALNSIDNTKDAVYWLGNDRSVYRARGGAEQVVSSAAIAHAIEGYTTVSDAYAYTFVLEGKHFYCLNFPTENATWILNEELGVDGWFQLAADVEGNRYNISSIVSAYGKNLAADITTG